MKQGKSRYYTVVPRLEDPLFEEGRARLIWAANTAESMRLLGVPAALVSLENPRSTDWKFFRCRRTPTLGKIPPEAGELYNIDSNLSVLYARAGIGSTRGIDSEKKLMRWWSQWRLKKSLFDSISILHTRDWPLVKLAVKEGIPTVFEEHAESFHLEIGEYEQEIVGSESFLAAVAISEDSSERMVRRGVPSDKIVILQSGLNNNSLSQVSEAALKGVRDAFLVENTQKLIVYAGGLYTFRGVDLLIEAAEKRPEYRFLLCGGRGRHVKAYREKVNELGLKNVTFSGYQPLGKINEILQAADVLVLPYADAETAKITSPLKFFEYLAAGRPVVAAELPMLQQFKDDSALNVFWVKIGDSGELLDGIDKATKSEGDFEYYRRVAEGYTWQNRQKKLFKFLEKRGTLPESFGELASAPQKAQEDLIKTPDSELCFVISEYNRGWVLETICRNIERYYPGRTEWGWTRKNSSFTGEIPNSKRYWFSHFQLLITCLDQFPWMRERELYVWYTHPSKDEIPMDKIVDSLNACHKVIFTCSIHMNEMIKNGVRRDRSVVVLGGVEPDAFLPHSRGSGKVGFCSAYYARKSPEIIIGLVQSMPDRQFLLLGPESEGMKTTDRLWTNYERFDELIALPNFEYVEAAYEDYPKFYSNMDVFVMPSRLEGGPIPLLEAMMCNVVPVSSITGFAPDLIKHGKNGFLFDVNAPLGAIADLVDRAFDLDINVRNTVTDYSWKGFTKKIVDLSGLEITK